MKRISCKTVRGISRILLAVLMLQLFATVLLGCGKATKFTLPDRTLPENAEQQKYEKFRYKIYDDDTILLTEYKGEETEIVIPDKIDGRRVVALREEMFYQNKTITALRLGKYVEEIGQQCFTGCSMLETVELNDALWSLGEFAFSGTPWLDKLLDPNDGEVAPPETSDGAEGETVPETTKSSDPADDFLIVGNGILLRYLGKDKNIVIPDTVKHIADAFVMTDIISVTMGDSVATIGGFAFAFCPSLTLVEFGKNVVKIGDSAFYNCVSLTSVVFPDKLEVLGSCAFCECLYLNSVRMNDALRSIGTEAFYNCGQLRLVYLPLSLKAIPVNAFGECLSLELVMYAGTEKDFKSIVTDTSNYPLLDATILYESTNNE